MKLTAKQINEIAQELECGMRVYLNRETLEFKTVLDWDTMIDPEPWEEEMEEIENEWTDYIVLEKMESRDSFRIMADFVEEVEDKKLREDLIKILNRKSPFANFKYEIESSHYREQWFKYRTWRYEEHVKELLEMEGIEFE